MELPSEPIDGQAKSIDKSVSMANGEDSSCPKFDAMWLLPETWLPVIVTREGRVDYMTYVAIMIERIRSKDGSIDEASKLFKLLNTEGSFDFLGPAVNQLPELNQVHLSHPRGKGMALLVELVSAAIQKGVVKSVPGETQTPAGTARNGPSGGNPAANMYKNGLSQEEKAIISQNMFGPGGPGNSSRQQRLLESTIQLGFPPAALSHAVEHARATNTEILRDAQGLPSNLVLPPLIPSPVTANLATLEDWVAPWHISSGSSSPSAATANPATPENLVEPPARVSSDSGRAPPVTANPVTAENWDYSESQYSSDRSNAPAVTANPETPVDWVEPQSHFSSDSSGSPPATADAANPDDWVEPPSRFSSDSSSLESPAPAAPQQPAVPPLQGQVMGPMTFGRIPVREVNLESALTTAIQNILGPNGPGPVWYF